LPLKKWIALGCYLLALPCFGNNADPDRIDALKRMSFEELMNVEVTSVSRTEEPIRDAAAAVAIVTNETIRRSGATTLPDSLRLVPGIHVGEQNSSAWAVSARGFSSITSEKLLVLSDTRSLYTPFFSGVFWDSQDYLLEDVERVEVIRGPGATLWGSNAVNGVINITTRSARDTHGAYLEAGFGTFDRVRLGARYGGETDGGVNYRVFGKYLDRNATQNSVPLTDDDWQLGHLGFRMDWDGTPRDSFTVQGDVYQGEIGQLAAAFSILGRPGPAPPLEVENSGGNVLARWRRRSDDGSDLQLRAYYDYAHRNDPSFGDTLNTFDVDLQQRFPWKRHEIIWGAAYRLMADRSRPREIFALDPRDSNDQLFSGFIQDQVAITDALRLTFGTKVEHNDFSGFEWQPSIRMAWLADERNTLWMAVSRAVRVPTRIERDIDVEVTAPGSNPALYLLGSDEFESERLVAYEAGYRWRPRMNLSFDLAMFYNDYDDLASLEIVPEPFIDPDDGRIIVPIFNMNLTTGRTYGAELLAEWEPVDNWLLTASYSYIDLALTPSGQDLNRGEWIEDATPRNLAGLRSWITLGERFEIDAQLRYQSRIRRIPTDPAGQGFDAYSELDLRFGWRVSDSLSVSLLGQNLLHESHEEFGTTAARGRLERAAYLKADWRL
jgi:iron complex outermembrane receptor protein